MEYTKTSQDEAREKADLNSDPVLIFLRNQDDQQFNVGDVLIRMYRHGDEWKPETFSSTADTPKKYLYAFQNELGIGYVKPFKTNGKLSEVCACLTQFVSDTSKFVLDPEYADHIMLSDGEEFKPTGSFKEKKKFRDKAIANNKKLMVPKDNESVTAWFNNRKVGDEFYYGYSVPDMVESKYRVLEVTDKKVGSYDSYYADRLIKQLKVSKNDSIRVLKLEIIKHRWQIIGKFSELNVTDIFGQSILDKEPFPLTEAEK